MAPSRWTRNRWLRRRASQLRIPRIDNDVQQTLSRRIRYTPQEDVENIPILNQEVTPAVEESNTSSNMTEVYAESASIEIEPLERSDNYEASTSKTDVSLSLSEKIAKIAFKYNIAHGAIREFARLFRENGHQIPIDPRTIMRTITAPSDESFVHLGLTKNLIIACRRGFRHGMSDSTLLEIQLNIDGVPLYPRSSSKVCFWPILGRVVNCKDFRVFAISIFCGLSKPPCLENYLRPIIQEIKYLSENGLHVDEKEYKIKVSAVICDTPARSYVKSIKGHNSKEGCERCIQKGKFISNRMTFPLVASPLRTNGSFRSKTHQNHHKGTSPFTEIDIDMVRSFPLDYMHLYCLGVHKRWTSILRDGEEIDLQNRLNAESIVKLNSKFKEASKALTQEINRKVPSFAESAKWKASQHRTCGLYLGPVVFRGILSEDKYNHFLLLHVGMRILASADSTNEQIQYAGQCLRRYVYDFGRLYGQHHLVYNVHSLIHLSEDCAYFNAPIDAFSSFSFETYLGQLKRLLRGSRKPLAQIQRRLSEMDNHYNVLSEMSSEQLQKKYIFGLQALRPGTVADSVCLIPDRQNPIVIKVTKISNGFVFGNTFNLPRDDDEQLLEFFEYPVKSTDLFILIGDGLKFPVRKWPVLYFEECRKCMAIPFEDDEQEDKILIIPLINRHPLGFISR